MLKRKLLRTGLFGNVLLLILAIASSAGTQPVSAIEQATNDSTQLLHFDPLLLQLNSHPEMDLADAPPIKLNKQAVKFVNDYITKNSSMLQIIKENNSRYFAVMDSVFTRYRLPVELKYLAIVESQLKTKAVSRVGAVGAWQFMPATAKIFSLRVTAKYDERTHFYKSTVAAARYLRDLHRLFDDWLLVMAAYNAGPGPVYTAIKKSGSRNFWKLQNHLPEETRGHVKKFISTHYYFEGSGSVTTLTKDERIAYTRVMLAYVAKQNKQIKEKQVEEIANLFTNSSVNEDIVAKTVNVGELKLNEN